MRLDSVQKEQAALAIPCRAHDVPAGAPCPDQELRACMTRREDTPELQDDDLSMCGRRRVASE
jgi:hypothetical protein